MVDRTSTEHLSPEIFVDLLDAAPVDATYRQHLSICSQCRQELTELERTLSALSSTRAGEVEAPDSTVPPLDRTAKTAWRYALWASAAAVLLSVLVSRTPNSSFVTPTVEEYETLLAPIEEDEDYRLLLAVSRDAEDPEFLFDAVQYKTPFSPDPFELTPGERRTLLEELAQILRSSS